MTLPEMRRLIADFGGRLVNTVTSATSFLIVGQDGYPLGEDGRLSQKLEMGQRLVEQGYSLEIVDEDQFLQKLDCDDHRDQLRRRYTLVQLTRFMKIPRDRIRRWMRAGLLEPVETVHRLQFFDFQQVSRLRLLEELQGRGVTAARLRNSVSKLTQWMASDEDPITLLSATESSRRRIVFRLGNGCLAEPDGQLLFEFDDVDAQESDSNLPTISLRSPREHELERAVDHEDRGQFREATEIYRVLLKDDPDDATLHFNLGNALYGCGECENAARHFRRAVSLDDDYPEAWNNLGSVLTELGETDGAVEGFQQALRVRPDYADAHYNLADVLDQAGRYDEARPHWMLYLQLDRHSEWADHVRSRLSLVGVDS